VCGFFRVVTFEFSCVLLAGVFARLKSELESESSFSLVGLWERTRSMRSTCDLRTVPPNRDLFF